MKNVFHLHVNFHMKNFPEGLILKLYWETRGNWLGDGPLKICPDYQILTHSFVNTKKVIAKLVVKLTLYLQWCGNLLLSFLFEITWCCRILFWSDLNHSLIDQTPGGLQKKMQKTKKQNNSDTKDDKLKMVVGTCWTSVTITRKIHQYYSERKLLSQSHSNCESFSLCPFAHSGQLRESPSFTSCSIEETFFMLQDHTLPSVCGSSLYCSNCLFTSARFQYLTWSVACRIKLKSIHLENNVNFLNLHVFFFPFLFWKPLSLHIFGFGKSSSQWTSLISTTYQRKCQSGTNELTSLCTCK